MTIAVSYTVIVSGFLMSVFIKTLRGDIYILVSLPLLPGVM